MRSLIDIQDDLLEDLLKESGATVKKGGYHLFI